MKSITKKIPLFKPGDKYIHFTKYGGINTGTVQHIRTTRVLRTFNSNNLHPIHNQIEYIKYTIIIQNGVQLDIDGSDGLIYKVLN